MINTTVLYTSMGLIYLMYFIESFHDFNIEKLYDKTTEHKYVRRWHKIDWLFHTVCAMIISLGLFGFNYNALMFIVYMAFIRQLTLNTSLNVMKKKAAFYLGSEGIDGFLKKYELPVFMVLIILNLAFLYYFIHYTCDSL